ncbi:mitochondrial carrier homolog 2 isoform X2 [Nomia melanderi]|uniref:mitochondrial carrier homolog 2 isoform X2 n=1 Tax=Nomia melanderi TaxID=2448451 RepID=UPI003FCCAB3F
MTRYSVSQATALQIGHEPILPRPTTTLFRRPALVLPNVFEYVKYIKNVDGISGCYRGVIPKMCADSISAVAFNKTLKSVKKLMNDMNKEKKEEGKEESEEDERYKIFIYELIQSLSCRMVAIVASHPFDVISIRMMAQFVGRETKYNGLFRSIMEVYKENGVMGYYAGLVPRLIGNAAAIILFSTFSYLIDRYILNDEVTKVYVDATIRVIATTVTYPYLVVSHSMAVNNCGLVAGLPPHMPIYTGWLDCWSHLSATKQLQRGQSLIWRYYAGQQIIRNGKPIVLH